MWHATLLVSDGAYWWSQLSGVTSHAPIHGLGGYIDVGTMNSTNPAHANGYRRWGKSNNIEVVQILVEAMTIILESENHSVFGRQLSG